MKKLFTVCVIMTTLLFATTGTKMLSSAYAAKPVAIRAQNEYPHLSVYKKTVKRYCTSLCKKMLQPNIRACIKAGKHLIKA